MGRYSNVELPPASHAKIVVFGSSAIDIHFGAGNFPEPGVEKQAPIRLRPGGKGFISAKGCRRLEAQTWLISSVGSDDFGVGIKQQLQDEGVNLLFDDIEAQRSTDLVGVFQSAGGGKTAYLANRDARRLPLRFLEKPEVVDKIKNAHVLLMSFDAAIDRITKMLEIARASRTSIVINASPPSDVPLASLKGTGKGAERGNVDFVVATKAEALAWLKRTPKFATDPRYDTTTSSSRIAAAIQDEGAKYVVITTDDAVDGSRRDEGDTSGAERCIVADERHIYTYRTYRTTEKLGSNGARSAFCSALAVSYAQWLESSPAQGATPPLDDFINFAATARHFAYQRAGGDQPSLADVQSFWESGLKGATLESTDNRVDEEI